MVSSWLKYWFRLLVPAVSTKREREERQERDASDVVSVYKRGRVDIDEAVSARERAKLRDESLNF